MHLWHDVSVGENAPDEITVIIEIPKGSNNKYEIDKETGMIGLDRVLFGDDLFPADYGFIPQTLWEDGDALDAYVLTTNNLFPGCVLTVRPVGIIRMIDGGEGDDKLICVPTKDIRFKDIKDLSDVPQADVQALKSFLENYKKLQNIKVEITGIEDAAAAKEAVRKGMELYKEKFNK